MQCDLCGKKVDFDNVSTYEGVAGSKLCRSCLSMMRIADNAKMCIVCKKEVFSFYHVEGNILCESCFEDHDAAKNNEIIKPTEHKPEGESRISKAGIIAALIFLFSFAASFAFVMESARTNPGDSGESGILLLPFVSPWIFMVPADLIRSPNWAKLNTLFIVLFVILNTFLVYFLFGGMASLIREWKNPDSSSTAINPKDAPDRNAAQ